MPSEKTFRDAFKRTVERIAKEAAERSSVTIYLFRGFGHYADRQPKEEKAFALKVEADAWLAANKARFGELGVCRVDAVEVDGTLADLLAAAHRFHQIGFNGHSL